MIITIDGPNSVGKGTLASKLAKHYDFAHFDTGMVYRAVGIEMLEKDIPASDEKAAEEFAQSLTFARMIELSHHSEFRGPQGSFYSSQVAAYPGVRSALLKMQQDFANANENVIYDGRDTGTLVCPNADIKFFITASNEVKAQRRHQYYQNRGVDISYEEVLKEVIERDEKDRNRAVSPLKPAEDAIIIDTSNLSIEEAFEKAREYIER